VASFVGVSRAGQMDVAASQAMRFELATALGRPECSAAVGDAWAGSRAEAEIDRAVARDGVADGWLGHVGASAEGDYVLVVAEERGELAGSPRPSPPPATRSSAPSAASVVDVGSGLGKGKGVYLLALIVPVFATVAIVDEVEREERERGASRPEPPVDIVGTLYSRAEGKTVAVVHARFVGATEAEALHAFPARLVASLPGLACAGWRPSANR
jgi:hypothetical protein